MKQILLGAAMALGSLAVQAGSVQITVTDKDGKPTPDVVVLVETPGRPVPANVGVTATIAQEDLKFQPFLTVVPAGSTLRFVNRDGYDHHVRSMPSGPLHDAAEVARAGIPTVMMFVQSLRGISHNKIEDTQLEHIAQSVVALDKLASKTIEWIQRK